MPELKDVLPAALPPSPEPFRPSRPARFKIVCSYQNFFEQQSSSSSSRVMFLKGQDLEFRIVDTERGDADDFPTEDWVWSLVKITSARRQERAQSRAFPGSGTYLRTNDLFLGEWRLIAKHRLRRESCSIVLVGRSTEDWSIFKGILPKARLDPDGYLERMSTCLRVNMLGNRCEEAADPSDGKELSMGGADSWEVHERLEKRLARTKGLARLPIQALYTDLSTGKNYALRAFLAVVDGKWLLTDWSCPTVVGRTGWFEGGAFVGDEGDREGILKAFKAWEDGNRYGFGSIHWRVLVPSVAFEMQGAFATSGTTDLDEFSHWLQYVGTAGMAAELVPNKVVNRTGRVLANLSFAVSSGVNIYQKWSQGFNSFSDWMENGLDLLVLALTLAGLKREASEIFAKAGVKNAEALAGSAQEVVVSGKKWSALAVFEVGAGFGMMAVCHATALKTVVEIQRRTDLTPEQKVDQLWEALELLVIQDLIMIVTRSKAAFDRVAAEVNSGAGKKPKEGVRNLDEKPGSTQGERHETVVSRKPKSERPDPGMQADEGAIPEVRSPEQERILRAKREELIKEIQDFRDRPLDPNHKMETEYKGKPVFDTAGNRIVPSLDVNVLMSIGVEGNFPIRIRKGTNGKVAFIGIGMNEKGGVCDMSVKYVDLGYTTFLYAGKNLSKTSRREFACLSAVYGNSKGWIPNKYLEGSYGHREDIFWSQKVIDDGYTVVDMGNPFGRGESVYYTSESEIMDGHWVTHD